MGAVLVKFVVSILSNLSTAGVSFPHESVTLCPGPSGSPLSFSLQWHHLYWCSRLRSVSVSICQEPSPADICFQVPASDL